MTPHIFDAQMLGELFVYDPKSGELLWKVRDRKYFKTKRAFSTWNARYSGKNSGMVDCAGYVSTSIFNRTLRVHTIIWAMAHGNWPEDGKVIDHINGKRDDNRIENLRVVSHRENTRNSRIPVTNTSGSLGVSFIKSTGRWRAYISIDRKQKWLGSFETANEAASARIIANADYGFHQNHGRAQP